MAPLPFLVYDVYTCLEVLHQCSFLFCFTAAAAAAVITFFALFLLFPAVASQPFLSF